MDLDQETDNRMDIDSGEAKQAEGEQDHEAETIEKVPETAQPEHNEGADDSESDTNSGDDLSDIDPEFADRYVPADMEIDEGENEDEVGKCLKESMRILFNVPEIRYLTSASHGRLDSLYGRLPYVVPTLLYQ